MNDFDFDEQIMDQNSVNISDNEYNSDGDEFYFESDHLALRGNSDYRSLLRTIVILEAQKIEATKHIDRICEAHRIAKSDPETFVAKLSSGEKLNVPGTINIQNLPKIKFEKYNVTMPVESISQPVESSKEENDLVVRGRVFDQTKPETFNQLWTCEEQRRLEELLIEYPPEPIEMRRFAKIARALGNRTARQVASRLQKYFQKLHAAGLPVPGRIPRNAKSNAGTRKHRLMKHMIKPTTFFPSNYVPVHITEDDDANTLDPNFYRNGCNADHSDAGNNDGLVIVDAPSDTESETSDEQTRMIQLINRIKRDKERDYPLNAVNSDHIGYKCDYCNDEPISGTRWHCITCKDESIDFCSDCLITQMQNEIHHSVDHIIFGYRISSDYRSQSEEDESESESESDQNEDDEMMADISDEDLSVYDDESPIKTEIIGN